MAEDDKDKLNEYYKKAFNVDFAKLSPEQVKLLDDALNGVSKAEQPYFISPNGKVIPNKDREDLMNAGGLSKDDAYGLGIYANYKAGIMPNQINRELLRSRKVPEDQLDRLQQEYDTDFKRTIANRFAQFVNRDETKNAPKDKNEVAFEPDVIQADPLKKQANSTVQRDGVNIPLPTQKEQKSFDEWLKKNKVNDPFNPEQHYDYVGAFRAGEGRGAGDEGHFTDRFKLPGHETFSNESQYAVGQNAAKAGQWDDEIYLPPLPPMQPQPTFPQNQLGNNWTKEILVPPKGSKSNGSR